MGLIPMPGQNSAIFSISQIDNYHGHLCGDLRPLTLGELSMTADGPLANDDAWRATRPKGGIAFNLMSSIGSRSGARPIMEFSDLNPTNNGNRAWYSWREEWDKPPDDKSLQLLSVNVAFFWGQAHDAGIVFRAEWEQAGRGAASSGHPHWHCDTTSGDFFEVKRIHFPMAGWTQSPSFPECWRSYPVSTDDIRCWARRLVQYMKLETSTYQPVQM